MLRKGIFWAHLICGVVAGLVVLMMSVTGVLLTYERQVLAWDQQRQYGWQPQSGQQPLALDQLVQVAVDAGFTPDSVTVAAASDAPLVLRQGRAHTRYQNPYTGEIYVDGNQAVDNFFHAVVRWHRWFNAGDDHRDIARAVTGASNLAFLFLVLSGLYLWLPAIYRWSRFRLRLWFHPNAKSGKARDFNWHHVFGFWFALPLVVIVATATVFNYSWANALVYQLAGEEAPQRRGRGGPPAGERSGEPGKAALQVNTSVSLQGTLEQAAAGNNGWRTLTLRLPKGGASEVQVLVDRGTGGQPQLRSTLTLDGASGAAIKQEVFADQPKGRQYRSWVRFLHTGEALGIWGQTLAGLASLAAALMVWTGLALSLYRFRAWRKRRNKARTAVPPVSRPA